MYKRQDERTDPKIDFVGGARGLKELEKRGIGRPSTYQEIITNIQDRGYVKSVSKRLFATKIANLISDRLNKGFSQIMDYGFTADMERNLDEIASGNLVWRNLLEKFSDEFEQAKEQAEDLMERNKPIDTQIICDCGRSKRMQLRTNQSGQFLGCEAFILEGDEQCKNTLSLLDEELFSDSDDKEAESIFNKTKCLFIRVDVTASCSSFNRHIAYRHPFFH